MCFDGSIRLWDASSGEPADVKEIVHSNKGIFTGAPMMAFTGDGSALLVADYDTFSAVLLGVEGCAAEGSRKRRKRKKKAAAAAPMKPASVEKKVAGEASQRSLAVTAANAVEEQDPPVVAVEGIPTGSKKEDIEALFGGKEKVSEVQGAWVVRFASTEAADKAVAQWNGFVLETGALRLSPCKRRAGSASPSVKQVGH
jgi:hypothetical protein